jgi:Rrf2 family transcriptional regulator, iron-sulfur cluster assembly transcription factor
MGQATFIDEAVLAIEVVIDIARLGPVKGADLALRQGLHPRYLEGLLHRLARKGIVVGERGRSGGYDLARDATLITACDVVRAAKSKPTYRRKAYGTPAVRELLEKAEEQVFALLHNVTIACLADGRRGSTPAVDGEIAANPLLRQTA